MSRPVKSDHLAPYIKQKRERIFSALRQGQQIIIKDHKGHAAYLRAAEFADFPPQISAGSNSGSESLCLTPQHLIAMGREVSEDAASFSIPAATLSAPEILTLITGQNPENFKLGHLLAEKKGSLPDIACRLLRAAKLLPSALLSRLIDSSSAAISRLAENHLLVVVDSFEIGEIIRPRQPQLIISSRAKLPLAAAENSEIVMFREEGGTEEHFAVIVGSKPDSQQPPLVRLHSQCVTGDVLGSLKCDCGQQLQHALSMMNEAGHGVLIYLEQEGRDIGLLNKIRAYALQDKGLDTVDANHRLGFNTDERVFAPAAAMLKALDIGSVRLLTNNPDKVSQLSSFGVNVVERIGLALQPTIFNKDYLNTKRDRTGHLIPQQQGGE